MSRTLRSTPIGLGGVGLSSKGSVPGVPGLKASSINAGKSAKGRKATVTNALPFLELSIAIGDGLSNFKSSIDEELVLQATLQVPAHHALSCRVQAYGTPFAAPDLHTMDLTDADLEFATCMAAPPDIEEQPSFSLTRMASLLERNTLVTPHRDAAGGPAAARVSPATAAMQQTPAMKAAPKVLISVDDDQSPLPLSRSESLRSKQRKLLMAAGDTARRTLGTLLGVGVLLQQLHESAVRQLQQHLQAPSARARGRRLAAARQLAPAVAGLSAGGAPLTSMDDGNAQLWGPDQVAAAIAAAGTGRVAGHGTREQLQQQARTGLAVKAARATTPAGRAPEQGTGSPVWGLSRAPQVAPEQLSSWVDGVTNRGADETHGPSTPEPMQQQQRTSSSASSRPEGQALVRVGPASAASSGRASSGDEEELPSTPSVVVQTFLHTPAPDGACSKVCLSPGHSTIASHRVLQTAASIRKAGLEPVTPHSSPSFAYPSWWEPAAAAAAAAAAAEGATSSASPSSASARAGADAAGGAGARAAIAPLTVKQAAAAVAAGGISAVQGACELLGPGTVAPAAADAAAPAGADGEGAAPAAAPAPVSSFSAAASVPMSPQEAEAAERHARAVGHWQRPVRRLLSIQLVCHPSMQRPGVDDGSESPIRWSLVSPVA